MRKDFHRERHVIAVIRTLWPIKYLRENVRLNKVKNIEIKKGDARRKSKEFRTQTTLL